MSILAQPQPAQPRCVKLIVHPVGQVHGVTVDVLDARTGNLLFVRPLKSVAAWLEVGGYAWRTGSNGLWERS